MAHSNTDIILPKSIDPFPRWITSQSSKAHKRAIQQLATYFQRELKYDFIQYTADEIDPTCQVYTWDDTCYIPSKKETGYQLFGAACFRFGQRMGRASNSWYLTWVWMHPYFRQEGSLSRAWPIFLDKFGRDLFPEFPYSHGMKKFLLTRLTNEQKEVFQEHGDWEAYLNERS